MTDEPSGDLQLPDKPGLAGSVFGMPGWFMVAAAIAMFLLVIFGLLVLPGGETSTSLTVPSIATATATPTVGAETRATPQPTGAPAGAAAEPTASLPLPNQDQPVSPPTAEPSTLGFPAEGIYVISEESALAALRISVVEPESARGSLVIDDYGVLTGSFTLVYRDTYGSADDEQLARATAGIVLFPVALGAADGVMYFDTHVDESILIDAPDRSFMQDIALPVSGEVVVEADLIHLWLSEDTGPAVVFVRTPGS